MKTMLSVSLTGVLFAGSASIVAAPQQTGTVFPGQPTQARVWIENLPLPVEVTRAPATAITGILHTEAARQAWEYRTISVSGGLDTAALNAAGADGWEAIGVTNAAPNAIQLLMKRPR